MGDLEIGPVKELAYDDGPHIYRVDGIEVPSVTTIMEPLSNAEYGNIDRKTLDAAAAKGTAVHNAIENWLKFGFDDLDPEYHGYMNGFLEWWKERKPKLVASEFRAYHKIMRYAGTLDLIAIIDGELNLIDFKTTYKLVEKNCRVQLEAYSQMLDGMGVTVRKKRILHLRKDGRWEDPFFPEKDAEAWRVFGSLKCLYDYKQA